MGALRSIIEARSIAVVGASPNPINVGYQVVNSLLDAGYTGQVYPVHPSAGEVLGLKAYGTLASVGRPIDLAVIALNPSLTVETVRECGRLGIPGAVCIAGGFRELGEEGRRLEEALVTAARESKVEIVGPNTLGIINTRLRLNATFYPLRVQEGPVSLLTQSGGVGYAFLQECVEEQVGLAKWIGVGNRGTLEFADYVGYLGEDPNTTTIGVFVEGTDRARQFVEVAGKVAREKPVVVYKVGRSDVAGYAALTHTGSMAGRYKVFSGAARQHGLLEAHSVTELVAACKALSIAPVPKGPRLGIVTITSGPSIVAADELAGRGATIEDFPEETLATLRDAMGRHAVVLKNPLDTAGQGFQPERFGEIVEIALGAPTVDVLLAITCFHKDWRLPTRELIQAAEHHGKPIVACYVSTREDVARDVGQLHARGIPAFTSIDRAVLGVSALVSRRRCQEKLGKLGKPGKLEKLEKLVTRT